MAASLIMWIIFIVGGLLILKIVKSLAKAVFMIISLGIILLFIGGALVTADMNDLQEKLPTSDNVLLLQQRESITTGIYMIFAEDSEPKTIMNIDEIKNYYSNKDLKSIKEDYYKVFFITEDAFTGVSTVDLGGKTFTKREIFNMIDSLNPIAEFEEAIGTKIQITDETEFKGILFASLIGAAIADNNLFLIEEYKKGTIEIYPETAVFKLIRIAPRAFMEKIIQIKGE